MNLTAQDRRLYRGQDQREVAAGRLDPDDLSRFEGEGGPEIPEPAASDPQESIYEPKQKGSYHVMSFKTFRRVVFESDHGGHYR
jgi:hypothetical protein